MSDLRILIPSSILLLAAACLLTACGGGGGGDVDPFAGLQTLTSVTPRSGATTGGTEVMLVGSGFTSTANRILDVRVGDQPAVAWEIVDDRTIVLQTPPGDPGPATIWVIGSNTPAGHGAILTGSFQYVAPTLYVADGPDAVQPQLYRVDVNTGLYRLVGSIGFAVEAMALGTDGMLHGVTAGSPYRLLRIDPASGVGEAVRLVRDAVTEEPVVVKGLTFLGPRLLGRTAAGDLVEIDRGTGLTTPVSALAGALPGSGIAAQDGVVFLAPAGDPSALQAWDPATDLVGAGRALVPGALCEALTAAEGSLYGLAAAAAGPATRSLIAIDLRTGEARVVASLPVTVDAIARHP